MGILQVFLVFLATLLAFLFSALTGGGASLLLIPVLHYLLKATHVPFVITAGSLFSSLGRIIVFFRNIKWSIFYYFCPLSIPSVIIGAYFLKYMNPIYIELFVAIFLLSNIPELIKKDKQLESEKEKYPSYVWGLVGFVAGFISGITGAVGLIFNRFYLRHGLSRAEIVATRAANEIFLHVLKIILYLKMELYSNDSLLIALTVALGAFLASYGIRYVLVYLTEGMYRRLGYLAMTVSGVHLLFSSVTKILHQENLYFYSNKHEETVLHWRQYDFVLEYSLREGLEVEIPIAYSELPAALRQRYDTLRVHCDDIFIEKIYSPFDEYKYEFYCYAGGRYRKYEFD